jgi:hypothetical protein
MEFYSMIVCKDCQSEWQGKRWTRDNGRVDYRCECGSKKIPVESDGGVKENRVLAIPDLHLPFPKEGYLEFLKEIYDKYECNTVIQMGDLTDGHYESRHATNTGAMNADDEFDAIKPHIIDLYKIFPKMKVIRGNHCKIQERQAASVGMSPKWIKTLQQRLSEEGLDISGWEFGLNFTIDGVLYTHGEGRKAKPRMIQEGMSIVSGHWHRESNIQWHANSKQCLFAMQLGALIDDDAYAFEYSKDYAKSYKNCGVIIDGKLPIIEMMEL